MLTVDRYLSRYVRRRRVVDVMCTLGWMVDVALVSLWCRSEHPKIGMALEVAGAACLGGFTLFLLVRKIPLVEAAMDIECRVPGFDQRLVTVVSIGEVSELVDQLREETEAVILRSKHISLVSIRKLIAPVIVGCGMAIGHYLIHRI